MNMETFDAYRHRKLAEGYDEVLIRTWEPNFANAAHTHPFDTDALVVAGEYWLNVHGQTTHYKAGDRFQVARDVEHAETYGPAGAVFWAARKNAPAA